MKRYFWNSLSEADQKQALARPARDDRGADVEAAVRRIVADVKARGNEAAQKCSLALDGFGGPIEPVPQSAFDRAWESVDADLHAALDAAIEAIEEFHQSQRPTELVDETVPGITCRRTWLPIRNVGFYIPAGRAPLPSTVLMLGVPSRLARNPNRIVCTPPRADGSVDPVVLVAARKCGLSTVFPLGGAQAIAAMAYGTETVGKVDKVFGPGNRYVDMAKRLVSIDPDGAAIDLPAGPSELMIIADEQAANATLVAADLLAQAEHDDFAHVLLVTTSVLFADRVEANLGRMLDTLPTSQAARGSLARGCSIVVKDFDQATEVANRYAPEHLVVVTTRVWDIIDRIESAGTVFAGSWIPAALGDYCSGVNHVLPTGGSARAHSGLSLESFLRSMTIQSAEREGIEWMGPVAADLARAEGLTAHERSVRLRIDAAKANVTEAEA